MAIKTRIVRIGNSQGVRIPKPLLEQAGLSGEVELDVRDNRIIIQPGQSARQGWADAFERMAEHSDDTLLDPELTASEWDEQEWTWE